MGQYKPPYEITETMLNLVAEIMESTGRLSNFNDLGKLPGLQRANRIKSIHSSLAIESNPLSYQQVNDVIDGKRVYGLPAEIQEVKNAYRAYEELEYLNPNDINEMKRLHGVMMFLVVDDFGKFRSGEEGVFDGDVLIHMAPPQKFVDQLMEDLFEWMSKSKVHPLILSSVFHYEFVFIHPFSDGNGRMARLWQTAILGRWKPIFRWLPMENIIAERQKEYYDAIADSNLDGSSTRFVEFMLSVINETMKDLEKNTHNHAVHLSEYVKRLLDVMGNEPMTAIEIMDNLGLHSKETFRKNYIDPAIQADLVELTIPDKPTSRNQRYLRKLS